jgi:hypothetical protein
MALTNAEKQARWRKRHVERRRRAAKLVSLLMRRSHSTGYTIETKFGWNTVTFDKYFYTLAALICDGFKSDREIKQLRWALTRCLYDRRCDRERQRCARRDAKPRSQSPELRLVREPAEVL